MTSAARGGLVVAIDDAKKRQRIEAEYQACCKAWCEQYEVGVRLMGAERDMKCTIAKALRDQQLRELCGEPNEPQWPGIA